ncbi:MAG: hypothetical protein ACOC2W_01845 [bacterium]
MIECIKNVFIKLRSNYYKITSFRYIRFFKFLYQKLVRGFPDSDTWSLDYTIAKFTLPRLKRFKEIQQNKDMFVPMDLDKEDWIEIIDMMIYAMESIVYDCSGTDNDIVWEDVETGLDLFHQYFRKLWW